MGTRHQSLKKADHPLHQKSISLFKRAQALKNEQRLLEALILYEKALKIYPCSDYLKEYLWVLVENHHFLKALQIIQNFLREHSNQIMELNIPLQSLQRKVNKIRNFLLDKKFILKHIQDLNQKLDNLQLFPEHYQWVNLDDKTRWQIEMDKTQNHIYQSQTKLEQIHIHLTKEFKHLFFND